MAAHAHSLLFLLLLGAGLMAHYGVNDTLLHSAAVSHLKVLLQCKMGIMLQQVLLRLMAAMPTAVLVMNTLQHLWRLVIFCYLFFPAFGCCFCIVLCACCRG